MSDIANSAAHQPAEKTEAQYQNRVKAELEAATKLTVAISRTHKYAPYVIKGYALDGPTTGEPLVRVSRPSLGAAATAFDFAAQRLRGRGAGA